MILVVGFKILLKKILIRNLIGIGPMNRSAAELQDYIPCDIILTFVYFRLSKTRTPLNFLKFAPVFTSFLYCYSFIVVVY